MQFQENFNKICEFPNYFDNWCDADKEYEKNVKKFNQEYETFKKEHDLENLYFARVCGIRCPAGGITEVFYMVSDLYLTYLEANDMLPKCAINERYLFKEQYEYNTPKEWLFRESMFSALEQQEQGIEKNGYTVYKSSMFEGITERVKLSNPSNGLPGMIIDRVPMAYEDLIDPKIKE